MLLFMEKGFVDTIKDLTMQRFSGIIQVGSTQSLVSLLEKGKNVKVKKKKKTCEEGSQGCSELCEMKEGDTSQEKAGGLQKLEASTK